MAALPDPVAVPPLDAKPEIHVDWLELVAFFSRRGVARLDRLDGAISIQEEDHMADNAEADAIADDRRNLIEEEIQQRSDALGGVYPFMLSDDGEELVMKPASDRRGGVFYLLCLIVAHFAYSPILLALPKPDDIARVRKEQFQVLATLAVAGMVLGPTISMGWPRATAETILEVLTRITNMGASGIPRAAPGSEASRAAKDGGMDVIAWQVAINNRPPPITMFFGQVASGHNWSGKSAVAEIDSFIASYYVERPATNYSAVTIIPHRLLDGEHYHHGKRHGHILDRLRTPRSALQGYDLATKQGVHVDGVLSAVMISKWVYNYRREQLAS
jgi:hypothetical protein